MKYTRDQFKTAAYLLWEKGTLRQPMENDKVYIVKYRTSDDGQYSRVTVKAESVIDALQQACYVVANENEILPENVDVHSVYDSQRKLLWGDDLPYVIANIQSDENGMSRREFLTAFGLANAALLFGLPKISKAATTSVSLSGTASGWNYVDDVFNAYLYTGNGSTQNITNGIDLAGHGGLVWIKCRSNATGHHLSSTASDITTYMDSSATLANQTSGGVTSVNSTGANITVASGGIRVNQGGYTYTSWTFRKAAKFFDVVTYTGDGTQTKRVAHLLGVKPGLIIIKRTDGVGNWVVIARHSDTTYRAQWLNLTDTWGGANYEVPTSSDFLLWGNAVGTPSNSIVALDSINKLGASYVAYVFAHDPNADGIIQCGSFTASSGSATINLGWEPQFVLLKQTDGSDNWYITDSIREFLAPPLSATQKTLKANLSNAESADGLSAIAATSTGFYAQNVATSGSYIYLAIRRPNKLPTSGTQVFQPLVYTGDGATTRNVSVSLPYIDVAIMNMRDGSNHLIQDRMRGYQKSFFTNLTVGESGNDTPALSFDASGIFMIPSANYYSNSSGATYVQYLFRRAPGFLDIVCYSGTGAARAVKHNLGVAPELMIVKRRGSGESGGIAGYWLVYVSTIGNTYCLLLNTTDLKQGTSVWNSTSPTLADFTVNNNYVNFSGDTYVAYLFASLAGISKVGSYTGSASDVVVPCNFTGAARFVLLKRTDSAGDWIVIDSARGQNYYLRLNTTSAEVNANVISLTAGGFTAKAGTVANVSGTATYIFLAIA